MQKPNYAKAMELRIADKDLNDKFVKLKDKDKWNWLAYACEHEPKDSIKFAKELIRQHEFQALLG